MFRQLKRFKLYGFLSNLKYPWHTNSEDYVKYSMDKYFELQKFIYKGKLIMSYDIKFNTFVSHADTLSVEENDLTHYYFFKTNLRNNGDDLYVAIWTTTV